jgi:hypothetical protein
MALHYQPTAEDIRAGELGIELSKLPVKDRISALFCCCDVHELDEIAKIPRRLCRWGTLQSVHGALANLRSQFADLVIGDIWRGIEDVEFTHGLQAAGPR